MSLIQIAPPQTPEAAVAGRVLHLVDVENLVGSAAFTRDQAALTRAAYEAIAPTGTVDQVVLASSHHAATPAWFAWPPAARRLARSGENGADLALLSVLENERVEQRFDHVVIGSGDGIFAFPAARLQAIGRQVTIVSRPEALSRQLRLAVRDIRFIANEAIDLTGHGRIA
jgi:hypothetical protein